MTTRSDIFDYVQAQWGTRPEYLWAKYPGYAVLRHPGSGRWYCVVVSIPREKAGLSGGEPIDALDLKCGPLLLGSLLGKEGYFPAYHMNKSNWVGVRLDGSVSREDLCWLLRVSYDNAGGRRKKDKGAAPLLPPREERG